MELSFRRYLLSAAVLAVFAILGSGRLERSFTPPGANPAVAATSDANAAFDALDFKTPSFAPPALIAGQPSHQGVISPIITPVMNGYCVSVSGLGVTPGSGVRGFSVTGTGKKTLNVEDAARTNGTVVAALGPISNASDTKYCAQITAAVGWTRTTLTWDYNGGTGGDGSISIDIQTANITMEHCGGTAFPAKENANEPLGRPAELCTVGWNSGLGPVDPTLTAVSFLTGRGSTEPNEITSSDWDQGPSTAAVSFSESAETNTRQRRLVEGQTADQPQEEQCLIVSATDSDGIAPFAAFPWQADYILDYSSIYQPWLVVTPPLTDEATFVQGVPELFFPDDPGATLSAAMVINAPVTVCISGTNEADVILASGLYFSIIGGPDQPNVINLSISNTQPRCVTWSSSQPGEHAPTFSFTWDPDARCDSTTHVCVAGPAAPITVSANWDSDGDGNGCDEDAGHVGATILAVQWNRIDTTKLTLGADPNKDVVTNTTITRPATFNIADGSLISSFSLNEWVYGSHNSTGTRSTWLLEGVIIHASIPTACGYFDVPNEALFPRPTVVTGVSRGGQMDLDFPFESPDDNDPNSLLVSTVNDTCGLGSQLEIVVEVFYPGQTVPALPQPETLTVTFTLQIAQKTPQFAWAGQVITLSYAVSVEGGDCGSTRVQFVRATGQPGQFLPSTGVTINGPDHASSDFGTCTATVRYESEDSGEVDIEAFIESSDNPVLGNAAPYSKVAYPIFYMLLEDVTVTATPTTIVSTPGDVSASLRGFFVGSNPSGRPAEITPDGRSLPADRWVMPADYEKLRGDGEFRKSWPSSVPMPAARVTFLMQNENVVNSYKTGVKNGAVGWLLPDDVSDHDFNINPITGIPSVLGSLARPRIMSQLSDTSGTASVDTFGDFNLTYEACTKSPVNGNPHCKPDDIVGHTTYYAVVDYPFGQKKYAPIVSNNATTEWTWFGYKEVTVVNTDDPQIKYVVAHLRDRDGFCDAYDFHNVLGVSVKFEIDAGGGVIIDAADRPYTINSGRRFVTATTFDILNDLNQPINQHIARTSLSDDECQAWIRVTNSLMQPTNVVVTFPALPAPVPGNIRVTGLTCTGLEQITVTNQGSNLVSLAGFSLMSPPKNFAPFEYFGLMGHLEPGQSLSFLGGPGADAGGWLFSGSEIFDFGTDYVSLIWDGFEIDRVYCDGREPIRNVIPASFPPDPEGEIVIDITIPFGTEKAVQLDNGWNLVTAGSQDTVIKDAFAGYEDKVGGVYLWDPVKETWGRYIVGAPDSVNTISKFERGKIYWVQVKQPFTLLLLK